MKIAFVHDHRFVRRGEDVFSSGSFPASIWEQRYLTAFSEVKVLARAGTSRSGAKELASAEGVDFVLLPSLSSLKSALTVRRRVRSEIRKALSQVEGCIVRLPSELGYIAGSEAKKMGLPLAVEVAGCPWDGMLSHGSIKGWLYAGFAFARMRNAVRGAPFVLYVTDTFLQRRYPPGVGAEVVACSNVELPTPSAKVLARREALEEGSPCRPLRLGLIGSLQTRSKGIQTVIAALREARDDLPLLEVRILGGGDQAPWEALAKKHGVDDIITFEGTLPAGAPVWNWLDGIDVYLQPSLKEGLPRALIEAMGRGCPALASRCAGIPELLDAENLIRPGDVTGLANLMRARVGDRSWRIAAARRNWKRAGNYSKPILDDRRLAFWNSFAASADRQN